MNRKITIFVVLCLAAITVWYSQRPDSMGTPTSIDSGSKGIESSPSDSKSVVGEQGDHRSRKLQVLAMMRDLDRKLEQPPHSADVDDRSENEIMSEEDNTPEQRVWRERWIDEGQDDKWTARMEDEVYNKADSLLKGDVGLRHLSCRETVCRMYLQFEGMQDAEVFTSAKHDPDYQYEYQLLNPPRPDAEHSQGSIYNYEVLVMRERPSDLPEDIRPLIPESTKTTATEWAIQN